MLLSDGSSGGKTTTNSTGSGAINWTQQADLVRSGTLSREATKAATLFQLQQLGTAGYTALYPEVYQGGGFNMYGLRRVDQLNAQITDLRQMQLQFAGPEATYIRWFLQNKINDLREQVSYATGGTPTKKTAPPPAPDWLMEYLETSMPAKAAEYMTGLPQSQVRGKATETLGRELRPMGAQAELNPEQMGLMAGYQAWGKAGSPTGAEGGWRGDERLASQLGQMADWQRYFQPYATLSEKLFPKKTNLKSSWSTALQR